MSDDNKNLGNDLNDMLDDAKDNAKKAGETISKKVNEITDEAKESAKEFSDDAKETFSNAPGDNKKMLAGILAILLGAFGVHKFILGYNKEGGILLGITLLGIVLSCVGVGIIVVWLTGLVGLIEGIIYLTKSDEDFYNTYQVGKKSWF
ncbi:TM2 domain-containing protein [Winogradskyella undariae]|uniref:TM2 domain-containing protein n=1 Tax=Winogradskyella undariae TaxID=1285465 RepID=UPI0015C86406|nr:TM2 domain-containing protein [Winogradskyella undariae]QNK76695.1 NINE protein [Winogradskyella sp. PAMC22761]